MADTDDLLEQAAARAVELATMAGEPHRSDGDLQALSRVLYEVAAALATECAQRRPQARDTIDMAVEAACAELARVGVM
jgi:hypothetical protein